MDLHITIPTYGQFDYVARTLRSLVRCRPPHLEMMVSVIDDCSPDTEWYEFLRTNSFPLPVVFHRYARRDGLTRSWNCGLKAAQLLGAKYAVVGNSDILFTPGWFTPLAAALEQFDLVGPLSNAPGHCPHQNISNYNIEEIDDRLVVLDQIANVLRMKELQPAHTHRINGFFMAAKTKTWWDNAFNSDVGHVFDPKYKLTGNEDELQVRWAAKGLKIGYVPSSFIFHYRSVSRPEVLNKPTSKGAFRPAEGES